jgi:hypothetical protein
MSKGMGKVIYYYCFFVGILCAISMIGLLIAGDVSMVSYLFFASIANFISFYLVRKAEKVQKKSPNLKVIQWNNN